MGAYSLGWPPMLKMPANLVLPDLPGAVFVSNHSEKLPEIRMSGDSGCVSASHLALEREQLRGALAGHRRHLGGSSATRSR